MLSRVSSAELTEWLALYGLEADELRQAQKEAGQ